MKHKKTLETYSSSSQSDSYEKDSITSSSESNSSNDLYEAEEILSKKTKNGKVLYKVKWKDYPINQSTWEPISNFNNSSLKLIQKFEKIQKEKKIKECRQNSKEEDKRFSKRLKVLSKKFIRPVEEILIDDSDSDSSIKERSSKKRDKKIHREEDSSVDSNELSPGSSDSSEKKRNHGVLENGKSTKITHRSKKSAYKSRTADIKFDKVKQIISGKITDAKNFQLNCLVEFEKRPDGYTPEPKNFSSDLVRVYSPQSLIDFYQSRISVNKKSP